MKAVKVVFIKLQTYKNALTVQLLKHTKNKYERHFWLNQRLVGCNECNSCLSKAKCVQRHWDTKKSHGFISDAVPVDCRSRCPADAPLTLKTNSLDMS